MKVSRSGVRTDWQACKSFLPFCLTNGVDIQHGSFAGQHLVFKCSDEHPTYLTQVITHQRPTTAHRLQQYGLGGRSVAEMTNGIHETQEALSRHPHCGY
jgi:hypothetical protein